MTKYTTGGNRNSQVTISKFGVSPLMLDLVGISFIRPLVLRMCNCKITMAKKRPSKHYPNVQILPHGGMSSLLNIKLAVTSMVQTQQA